MRDVQKRLPEKLLASVADDLAILLVDTQRAALGVLVGHSHGGILECATEPLFAIAEYASSAHL